MSDMTIDNATRDTSVGGGELVPVSDAGSPKSMSVSQIKDYVLAQIAVLTAADGVSVNNDSVYILKGGALKPVSAATLAAAIFNEAFGRAGVVSPNGNEVIAVKDSTARKTLTLGAIKTWLQSNMTVTPDLTLSTAGAAGTLGDSDLALVVQAASGKKVTLAALKDYVLGKLSAYISAATAANTVSTSDVIFISQSGSTRKATVAQLMAAIGGGDVAGPESTTEGNIPQWDSTTKKLKNGLALTQTVNSSSTSSQVPSAAAVHAAVNAKGDVKAPVSTTENKLPQWSSTSKTLKDGMTVQATVRDAQNATDDAIPTEKAVRTIIDTLGDVKKSGTPSEGEIAEWDEDGNIVGGHTVTESVANAENASDEKVPTEKAVRTAITQAAGVGAPESHTEGNIPTWGASDALTGGLSKQTSVRNSANASDAAIPTEKAVRTALDGLVKMPNSHTENAIPTWGSGSELKAGLSVVQSTTGIASAQNASDDKIPTEKAVRAAIPGEATTSAAGLLSASDKSKLNNLTDVSALDEINAALSDSDTIQVRKSDTTYKKSLLSRFWTYISGKLASFKIDDLAAGDDNTDLNTSTSKHGLCPKLSGNTSHFLRGDGTFASPPGSTVFTGTDGTNTGSNGLVPAPVAADENKFLSSDGTWKSVAAAEAEEVAPEVLAIERYDTVFIPAAAMVPSASNGATADAITFTNTKRDTMKFGTTYDDSCEFDLALPDDWNKGSLKAKFLWTVNDSQASSSTNVKWGIGCRSTADGESVSTAPTTFETVTDTLSQVNNLHRTDATGEFTPEGTSGDGNLLHFAIHRINTNPPSSPMSKNALLFGVIIQFARTSSLEAWS